MLLALLFASALNATDYEPVVPGPEGTRAFIELAKFYSDQNRYPNYETELRNVSCGDPALAKSSGLYLLALFKQSFDDESSGRAAWKGAPALGVQATNDARKFREKFASDFANKAAGAESLPAVLWLLQEDMLPPNQTAGLTVLRRINAETATDAIRTLLSLPHPNEHVLTGVIEDAAARELRAVSPEVARLRRHHRQRVRETAKRAAEKLKIEPGDAFKAEEAFTPTIEKQLRDIAGMVFPQPPEKAIFTRFTVKRPGTGGDADQVHHFSGFLLEEANDSLRVLNRLGDVVILKKALTTTAPWTFAQEVEALLKTRSGNPAQAKAALSRGGGISAQFEPDFISVPETVVAAWSFTRGDKTSAAALLFPRIEAMEDDRWLSMAARDLIGGQHHQVMLDAFSLERNYPRALEYSRHLSRAVFDGFKYQYRAKQLAEQLPGRMDEFKSFTLPNLLQWDALKRKTPRKDLVDYLAERLRLLNCIQTAQPGDVNYLDEQFAQPVEPHTAKRTPVINPYVELRNMKLTLAELPPLVLFLGDECFIPTYSWRDYPPSRTLHQVNWVVAEVVNEIAKKDLADLRTYFSLSAEGKRRHLMKIMESCRTAGTRP